MRVQVLFFEGCPHRKEAFDLLGGVLEEVGWSGGVEPVIVDTPEGAEEWGFRGSPTFLLDGVDPFADPRSPVGLSCRVYSTSTGPAGVPDRKDLVRAVREAMHPSADA